MASRVFIHKSRGGMRATLICFHEVEDVEHWLGSPMRDELFGPLGMTARAFRDPAGSNWTALIMEVPDVDAWQDAKHSEAGIAAMEFDGIRRETIVEFVEVPASSQSTGRSDP